MNSTETAIKSEPETAAAVTAKTPRRLDLRVSTVVTAVAVTALTASTITFGALYASSHRELAGRDAQAADAEQAERVAMDYAVGASTIDYRDTKGWLTKLKAGTSTTLASKFDATATQLDQILLPLQWTSKATPVQAVVVSDNGGVYKVNAFVDVDSTSVQTPQGGRVTVTYTVTLDKHDGWKITEVGGGLDAVPAK
ncbi:hypothetical protein [Nocardia inohanensis]|uniref:hypothetical protein n=1 Tax=Nocardia inohanensis TaxID=209246 RepID=UPI0008315F3A|nr:hypothetical protein [Nocardia inohanensis]